MAEPFHALRSLVIFGGLPGAGKTSVARRLAARIDAVYVRIDTIENAIQASGSIDVRELGYLVAYAVASDNLSLGRTVIADCVNPLRVTRDAWLEVARQASVRAIEVEVVCSNEVEHRRRLEARSHDFRGDPVTWANRVSRGYEAWDGPHLVVDTYRHDVSECTDLVLEYLRHPDRGVE